MSIGASVGRSPWTLTTNSARPAGSAMPSASNTRSEPEAWSARVITARPPALWTAASISRESVATTTGPTAAASARRSTWTIIGSPAISASGLPPGRGAALRAGIRMSVSAIASGLPQPLVRRALIRVATRAANRLFLRRPSFAAAEPFPDEFLRNQQVSRRLAGNLPGPAGHPYRQRRDFLYARAGQARLRGRRQGRKGRQGRSRQAGRGADRNAVGQRLGRAWRPGRQAVRHLPQLPRRPRPEGRSRSLRRGRQQGRYQGRIQLLGRVEGEGRHLELRRARQVAQGSARRRARHRHDLCGPFERKAASRRDRLSQFAVEESAAAAGGAKGGRAGKEVAGAGPTLLFGNLRAVFA